ncbi:MAG: UDP-N-acetylglucosamine 1-carboxyvinyltransferase [Clostridiales bacterium]|jgi:UDP-N-acetylglucosamine 1-carboxyvinyltransferase|nr:UDP-N-acetylglucosamine 1-carboxyvinyltransferase [Clostridiales bacterium]
MENYKIKGGNRLSGKVSISGGKNAVLPCMSAALLTEEECILKNVPSLSDVKMLNNMMEFSGALTEFDIDKEIIKIKSNNLQNKEIPYEMANKMRASFLMAGPLLARTGRARISMPGGCAIGSRPIDLHIKGFEMLGAKVKQGWGYVEAFSSKGLRGTEIYLDFPSVGATENIMMAACLAKGRSTIKNAAAEPEIVELADFLRKMGAKIFGEGSDTIVIEGVKSLRGATYKIIPDRIEAGTFMIAAAITGGDIEICNIIPEHLAPVTAKLKEAGAIIKEGRDSIILKVPGKLKPVDVRTLPYPGFPTDMQAQMTALMTQAQGTSVITETVFENRFLHVGELMRMGAHIKVEGRSAVVEGKERLTGASVSATDLRAGAALVIASLAAEGETTIMNVEHIERGYANLNKKLLNLGANITKE